MRFHGVNVVTAMLMLLLQVALHCIPLLLIQIKHATLILQWKNVNATLLLIQVKHCTYILEAYSTARGAPSVITTQGYSHRRANLTAVMAEDRGFTKG